MANNKYYILQWASIVTIILLTILIYYPGLNGPFVFDDHPNLINNKLLWNSEQSWNIDSFRIAAFSSGSGLLQRPISMISFAFNLALFGQEPYSFKVFNLIIHLINGVLLGTLITLLLQAYRHCWAENYADTTLRWIAVAIAAIWLVSPINLTAVLYVVQRMTSLSALFLLAALICYVWSRTRLITGKSAYFIMIPSLVGLGALSVFSKESGALLPIYMLIIEAAIFRFKNHKGGYDKFLLFAYLLLLVLPCLAGLIWITLNGTFTAYEGRLFTLPERLLTEARVLILYIKWVLLPTPADLSLYHDDIIISKGLFSPVTTFFSIIAIIGLIAIAIWQRKRRPLVFFGILWFFGGHLMESTVIPLELVFEHRNYLPSIGLFVATIPILLLEATPKLLPIARLFTIGIIIAYSSVTWLRANDWEDIVTLTALEAYRNPNSPRIAYDLGRLYGNLVTDSESEYVPLAYNALEHAAALKDSSILPDSALILLSYRVNRPIENSLYERMEKKLRRQPLTFADISALEGLVKCIIMKGCFVDNNQVMQIFSAALESPGLTKRPRMKALLLSQYTNYLTNVLGYLELAKEITRQLIALSPIDLPHRINLIRLLIATNDKAGALKELEDLRKLDHKNLFIRDIKRLSDQIEKTD